MIGFELAARTAGAATRARARLSSWQSARECSGHDRRRRPRKFPCDFPAQLRKFPACGQKFPAHGRRDSRPTPWKRRDLFEPPSRSRKIPCPFPCHQGFRLRVLATRTQCSLGRTNRNAVLAKRTQCGFGQTNPTQFWPNEAKRGFGRTNPMWFGRTKPMRSGEMSTAPVRHKGLSQVQASLPAAPTHDRHAFVIGPTLAGAAWHRHIPQTQPHPRGER